MIEFSFLLVCSRVIVSDGLGVTKGCERRFRKWSEHTPRKQKREKNRRGRLENCWEMKLTVSQEETRRLFGFVGAKRTVETESYGGEASSNSV